MTGQSVPWRSNSGDTMSTLTSQTLFRGAIFAILTLATTATMPVNQAAAEYRPIGAVSKSSLKASCAATGGHFEAANSGEYWREKNGSPHRCALFFLDAGAR